MWMIQNTFVVIESDWTLSEGGIPLGPLLANTFMCYFEENLMEEGKIPN